MSPAFGLLMMVPSSDTHCVLHFGRAPGEVGSFVFTRARRWRRSRNMRPENRCRAA
jgi:hypothetical protein